MRRPFLLFLWLLTDLAVFLGSYALAYFLRVGFILSTDFPFRQYMIVVLLVAPVWLATLVSTRTFSLMRRQASLRTIRYVVYAGVLGAAFFALLYYFLYGLFFSRLLLATALVLSIVLTWIWHLVFGGISRIVMRRAPAVYPLLIVGATREAASLIRALEQAHSPLKPVAVLDGRGTKDQELAGVPVLGKLDTLEETLRRFSVTHLLQCADLEQSMNLLSACRRNGITYLLLPSVLGIIERDERIETLEGRPVTVVRPKESWGGWFFS